MSPSTRRPLAVVAVLLLVALAYWGWQSQGTRGAGSSGSTPSNRAEIAGSAQPFALADCKPRLFDGAPAIALSFTQPLARSQDWGKLVKATEGENKASAKPVESRWVLGDNPRVLYLPFVAPDRTYNIELAAELAAAAGGASLSTAQTCTAKSEAMPASFYFASRGVVLPSGQNGGLPVVTVNTPEVDVQFLRVQDTALAGFLEQVSGRRERAKTTQEGQDPEDREYQGEYYDAAGDRRLKGTVSGGKLDQLRESSASVFIGRFATDARKDRRNVSFLQVEKIKELQEPGVYIAVMNPPGRFGWDYQVTYFYVTDIGLHVRRHATQTDVFATSLTSGKSIKGVDVSLLDEAGKALAQGRTDDEGHLVLVGGTDKARLVLARRGKEMSAIALRDAALDLSEFDVGGVPSRNQKLFVYAGRDLYRPGEVFSVSVLARDADGKPLPMATSAAGAVGAAGQPLMLVLKKPDGQRETSIVARAHNAGTGYYQQAFTLPANAPTGRWLLEARTDPESKRADAQWSFQVEEFLPERMKLDLKAPEQALSGDAPMKVSVEGNYLYGAPAAGNRLLGSVQTERDRNPVATTWPGFVFGDADDDNAKANQSLPEAELSAAGKADVEVPVQTDKRASPMKVRASFSLLESGGRPVVRSIERTWWPAPVLVGLRPLFDGNVVQEGSLVEFELARVDAAGKFAASKELRIKLVREERNWYWRYDDNRGWHSGYNVDEELVEARKVTADARNKIALPVGWGRYRLEVQDPETSLTTRYRFFAGWGAQDADDLGNRPDRVQLKLEGAPFKAGDNARLTITPPHDGEALVTVESDKVLYRKRVPVRTGGTPITIPIEAGWNRHDLYVGVVAFRPGSQGDRVTPSRALGLVHLPLSREARKLKLALEAPAKAVPEQRTMVKLKLADVAGKPAGGETSNSRTAIVTLSAVDVGILNITRYASPDPQAFFFGKHRYDADLLDLYGKLIEKMDGNLAKQRFGGDAGMRDTQSMPRKVRLVDLFSGPVALDANGEASIALDLPDFNGSLRLMAVASTPDSYASAAADMTVAAPIAAELAMPRFIAPGDIATIALDLTNLSGSAQDVSVQVQAQAPLKITGGSNAPVKLADKERRVLRFTAESTDAIGLAPITVTVNAGAIKLVRRAALQVQPATPLIREVRRLRLEPGEELKLENTLADGLWPASTTVDVTLSNKPPIDVRDAVQGLLMYPYGCLEQTTSSAYPLVFIDEAAAAAFGIKGVPRDERARRLEGAFGRIASMQQPQGGFGLWAANNPYEGWLSAYVAGFLQDARKEGFAVPETMEKRAIASLLEQFQRAPGFQTKPPKEIRRGADGRIDYRDWESMRMAHQRFAEAAHMGYILAREEKAPLATLRTLHDEYRDNARSPLALVHLSIALKLMGDEARARVALDEAMQRSYGIQPLDPVNEWWGEWLGDYGSRLRDQALAYALLHRHQIAHERRENLILDLADQSDRRRYYSTQERLAMFLAARAAGGDATEPWTATLQRTGGSSDTIESKGTDRRSVDVAALQRGIGVATKGRQPLFVEVSVQGYPLEPMTARDDRIAIERTWWTVKGEPLTGRRLQTGDMAIVRLRVQAKQRVKDGLIVDRIPAGLEVENLNLSQGTRASDYKVENVNIAVAMNDARIKHREYRDDRFVVAADLDGRALDVYYLVRVVTPGKYVVPAPFAEDMYRPDLRGVGKAEADILVVDPRSLP
jgi:uncharacterized protein YfaS (alpha-2-macroglobulin family)